MNNCIFYLEMSNIHVHSTLPVRTLQCYYGYAYKQDASEASGGDGWHNSFSKGPPRDKDI